jgi:hypothetical protein
MLVVLEEESSEHINRRVVVEMRADCVLVKWNVMF